MIHALLSPVKTEAAAVGQLADLTNCEREPIHLPGAVQPHGVLFTLHERTLAITCVSENAPALLGWPVEQLLGRAFDELLDPPQRARTQASLRSERLQRENPLELTLRTPDGEPRAFDGIAHRRAGRLILELEPAQPAGETFLSFHHEVRDALSRLRDAHDLGELTRVVAAEIRRMTGFDRVLVYRFDAEWNGEVIAEERAPSADPYLGLHFPASDIPRQARALYELNWLRIIPDVRYTPARLVGAEAEAARGPLDLSFSVLRSVSPIHLEYLRNMGAGASMSVSLLRDGKLWGLISCTHMSGPRYVPYEVRAACEFLGEIVSSLLAVKEGSADYDQRLRAKSIRAALLEHMTREVDFIAGLTRHKPNLLDLVGAQGAAVHWNGQTTLIGRTPSDEQITALLRWLGERRDGEVFATEGLSQNYPEAEAFKDVAAGLIAASLSRGKRSYVLWFRPEVVRTVDWGGNPEKPVEVEGGDLRLHPRKSFALWKETVRGRSLPWKPYEIEAAEELRRSIIDIVLQRSEELLRLNTELERSNVELDAFAYAASHDLKEPLRGIHNYTALVMRDLGDRLTGTSLARMQTIVSLTQRMESLINSLLHYAQVGRTDLSLRDVDLDEVLAQVLEVLRPRLDEAHVEVRIPRPLPPARGDRVRVAEIFTNLISNAIKYNDKAHRWVEVGYVDAAGEGVAYYVRDNGIGIRPEYHDAVFRIFKRLHGRDRFGGGTGTGLTIVKRIIERHDGSIWLQSEYGQGTTFFFTLGAPPAAEPEAARVD